MENNPSANLTAKFNIEKQKNKKSKEEKAYEDTRSKAIAALTKSILSCRKKADEINTGFSGNWTRKRAAEAEHRQKQKDRILEMVNVLETLLSKWESREPVGVLEKVRTFGDLQSIPYQWPREPEADDYQWVVDSFNETKRKAERLGITPDNVKVAYETMQMYKKREVSAEDQRKRRLDDMIKELRGKKIPGFFPTPPPLANRVIDLAEVGDGMIILDPAAGTGDLLDPLRERTYIKDQKLFTCEINYQLAEILGLKGYTVEANNMYDLPTNNQFDRIIMNPPFENGQDVDMVTHCFNYLLDRDGILVAIMSKGVQSNQGRKFKEFRDMVSMFGDFYEVEDGAFKNAFNSTGVSTCIVKLQN